MLDNSSVPDVSIYMINIFQECLCILDLSFFCYSESHVWNYLIDPIILQAMFQLVSENFKMETYKFWMYFFEAFLLFE